jgi:hypothetical protein
MAVIFDSAECEYDVEKFVRLNGDIFCWSEGEVGDKFWRKVWKRLDK